MANSLAVGMDIVRESEALLEAAERHDGGRSQRRGRPERRRTPRQQRLAEQCERGDGRERGDAGACSGDLGDARLAQSGLRAQTEMSNPVTMVVCVCYPGTGA
jgi:hypothetical protein